MFFPLTSLLVATGCATDGPPLSRLVNAWAVDTAHQAAPAISATLVVGALASELCVSQEASQMDEVEVGDPLSLSPLLTEALGEPIINELDVLGSGSVQMVLEGVNLMGREGQWARISTTPGEDHFGLELSALLVDADVGDEIARLEGYGQMNFTVDPDCTTSRAMVQGNGVWIDEIGHRNELQIPASGTLGTSLVYGDEVPYLPIAGTLGWSGKHDGQSRSLTTEDAVELRVSNDALPEGQWPVVVRGASWSEPTITKIVP